MRKSLIFIMAAVLCMFAAVSCHERENVWEPDPGFVGGSDVTLMVDGKTVLTYDQSTWQSSFREKTIRYRVFSDTMSDYWTLTCNQKPESEGQTLTATLKYVVSGSAETELSDLVFSVEKIDPETGIVRLWCRTDNIGVVILQ